MQKQQIRNANTNTIQQIQIQYSIHNAIQMQTNTNKNACNITKLMQIHKYNTMQQIQIQYMYNNVQYCTIQQQVHTVQKQRELRPITAEII